MDKEVERILYSTKDPNYQFNNGSVPAMTTVLHSICEGNGRKFDEAIRLISLFIAEALKDKP